MSERDLGEGIGACKKCGKALPWQQLCPICGDCLTCCPWESQHHGKEDHS